MKSLLYSTTRISSSVRRYSIKKKKQALVGVLKEGILPLQLMFTDHTILKEQLKMSEQ